MYTLSLKLPSSLARIPTVIALLPVLWLALALSENLSPPRSLWILAIVYGGLLALANTFGNLGKFEARYSTIIAYAVFTALGALKVNMLFAISVVVYGGLCTLEMYFRNRNAILTSQLLSAFTHGLFLLVTLYQALNEFPPESILTPRIMLAGILASTWAAFFSLLYHKAQYRRGTISTLYATAAFFTLTYVYLYFSGAYLPLLGGLLLAGYVFTYLEQQRAAGTPIPGGNTMRTALLWFIALYGNSFFFYLFVSYTQILQLLNQL